MKNSWLIQIHPGIFSNKLNMGKQKYQQFVSPRHVSPHHGLD